MSESTTHDRVAERLRDILDSWASRSGRNVRVARNFAVRWLQADPRIGIDPDVCVLEPPPEEEHLDSLFDPLLLGPRSLGGPVLLQRWRRDGDLFERVDFGNDPVRSEVLGAWLVPKEGLLIVADDAEGTRPWLNEVERTRDERDRERNLREALERELGELRATKG